MFKEKKCLMYWFWSNSKSIPIRLHFSNPIDYASNFPNIGRRFAISNWLHFKVIWPSPATMLGYFLCFVHWWHAVVSCELVRSEIHSSPLADISQAYPRENCPTSRSASEGRSCSEVSPRSQPCPGNSTPSSASPAGTCHTAGWRNIAPLWI